MGVIWRHNTALIENSQVYKKELKSGFNIVKWCFGPVEAELPNPHSGMYFWTLTS